MAPVGECCLVTPYVTNVLSLHLLYKVYTCILLRTVGLKMYIPALILLETKIFGFSTNLSIWLLVGLYTTTPYLLGSSTLVTYWHTYVYVSHTPVTFLCIFPFLPLFLYRTWAVQFSCIYNKTGSICRHCIICKETVVSADSHKLVPTLQEEEPSSYTLNMHANGHGHGEALILQVRPVVWEAIPVCGRRWVSWTCGWGTRGWRDRHSRRGRGGSWEGGWRRGSCGSEVRGQSILQQATRLGSDSVCHLLLLVAWGHSRVRHLWISPCTFQHVIYHSLEGLRQSGGHTVVQYSTAVDEQC